jgi:uncharacterized membrane protein
MPFGRLLHLWDRIRTSLWFVPTVMIAGAMLLAFVTLQFDSEATAEWLSEIPWIHSRTAAGARDLLGVVATSMVTIAGITFSIMVVALQLASQQLGPRMLRNFMRDLGNQVVLGTFIATFVYCLLVMRTIEDADGGGASARLSVVVGLLLAIASLGVLIYFIHHAAASMQAPNVITAVSRELHALIDRLYPERDEERAAGEGGPGVRAGAAWKAIRSRHGGYLQRVDDAGLVSLAREADAVIRLQLVPGAFVVEGEPFAEVAPPDACSSKVERGIDRHCIFDTQRTSAQDVEFELGRLVEIALRALSTGRNDAFTAVSCIDHLSAALVQLARRPFPPTVRRDDEGAVRLIVPPGPSLADLIAHVFDDLIALRPDLPSLTVSLLDGLGRVDAAIDVTDAGARTAVERRRWMLRKRLEEQAIGGTGPAPQ